MIEEKKWKFRIPLCVATCVVDVMGSCNDEC